MILDLGLIDYEECYKIQRELVAKRISGLIEDSVIIAEHSEVFTIGRTGDSGNILVPDSFMLSAGLRVLRVDRGGDVTFHGPGQILIYPVISLKDSKKDLHMYLRDLEQAAIFFLNDYSVYGTRIQGKTGVWVSERKIASIGVGASNWVTFHGMSLNVNCDLSFFSMINPCGIDCEMTSLERIKDCPINMKKAKDRILSHLIKILGIRNDSVLHRETVLA